MSLRLSRVPILTISAVAAVMIGAVGSVVVSGQGPSKRQAFEVAEIRHLGPDSPSAGACSGDVVDTMQDILPIGEMNVRGTRLAIRNYSLVNLIAGAYRVRRWQVSGPAWMSKERFNIDATLPTGPSSASANEALQMLLEDRFSLRLHKEKKITSGYKLVAAKHGAKLQTAVGGRLPGSKPALPMHRDMAPNPAENNLTGVTMADLADFLSWVTHRPVVDLTGVRDKYDITLRYGLDPGGRDSEKSVFNAVDSLGLTLISGKVSVVVLVIDHISRAPAAN